jgi:dTDP-4-dehydrorhamnose reductase
MSFLVTGASGLLGANLVAALTDRGAKVTAVSCRHGGEVSGVRLLGVDLTDRQAAVEMIEAHRPAWVLHCAAATDVDWCEENPTEAYRVNVEMSRNVAQAAAGIGATVVYISTDSVFDGKRGSYTEDDQPSPVNVYALSKLVGEEAVLKEDASNLIVRTNIYGWNFQNKKSLAEWMLDRLATGETLPAFRDVIFTPMLVNDVSGLLVSLIERKARGVYNVAGGEECSKLEFALRLADLFELDKKLIHPVSISDAALKAPRPRNTSLKVDKAARFLGRSLPDINSGLRHFKELWDSGFVGQLREKRDAKDQN